MGRKVLTLSDMSEDLKIKVAKLEFDLKDMKGLIVALSKLIKTNTGLIESNLKLIQKKKLL